MKRSTAIRHLVEMGEVATEQLRFRDSEIGWPLEEQWVTGELLGGADELDAGTVVLVLDLPAGELPWLAIHPTAEWTGRQLRLGKRPIHWSYRPLAWPVWNHENRRLVRFSTARDGLDTGVIEALQARQLDRLAVVEPSEEELSEQLREELAVSRRHLQEVLDRYWDRDWRREQTRFRRVPRGPSVAGRHRRRGHPQGARRDELTAGRDRSTGGRRRRARRYAGDVKTVVLVPRPRELEGLIQRRRALGIDTFDEVWEGSYHMAPAAHPAHGYVGTQLAVLLGSTPPTEWTS